MRICLALAIAILMLLTACTTTPAGEVIREQELIRIASILPLTGPGLYAGEWVREGLELALEEVNSEGGVNGRPIKITYEDDGCNPQKAVTAMNKLAYADNIKIILGPQCSSSILAVAPIAEKEEIIILAPMGSSPRITHAGDFIFRLTVLGSLYGSTMAEFAYNELNARTASVIYINMDNGIGYKEGFRKKFEELGGTIVSEEPYEPGTTDYRTYISKIKEKNPDVIFLGGQEAELAVKQIKELGIKAQILGPTTIETSDMIEIAGEAAEGIIYTAPAFDPQDKSKRVQGYLKKYKEKYGDISEYRAANAYDTVYIITLMIEKCGSERATECIRDELYKLENYAGVSGDITFDGNGDVVKPLMIKTIKNGQFVKYE